MSASTTIEPIASVEKLIIICHDHSNSNYARTLKLSISNTICQLYGLDEFRGWEGRKGGREREGGGDLLEILGCSSVVVIYLGVGGCVEMLPSDGPFHAAGS